jgi:hypothetical protein
VIVALLAVEPHHPTAPLAAATPPSLPMVVATGIVATLLASGLWSLFGHVITVAHEGAHALTGVALGGRIRQVRLNPDRTGSTDSAGAVLRLPVTAAGYVGPSAFGLAGSAFLTRGHADAVLWVSLVLLGLLFLSPLNLFGRFIVVILGAALFLTLQHGSLDVRTVVACTWVWLLLIGGLVHVWKHRAAGSDFVRMRELTHVVPTVAWAGLSVIAASAALLAGGAWLVGAATPPF